jgi:hypothetical protein
MILFASSILFACGGDDSSEDSAANPIDETAAAMHSALDRAEGVSAILEEQKKGIDDALEEAEESNPD